MSNLELINLLYKTATLSIVKEIEDPKTLTRTLFLEDAEQWGGHVRIIFDFNGNIIKYTED